MKTWRQLQAMARRQGFKLTHGDHTWGLGTDLDATEAGHGEWWTDDRKTRDRKLRAMTEAALRAGK